MKKLLLLSLFYITSCAQHYKNPEYIVTIPVKRVGNTYIAEYEGNVFPLIKVSDEFKYEKRINKFGLEVDQFNKLEANWHYWGRPFSEVYVINSFGVLKEKEISGFALKNDYRFHTTKDENAIYVTSVGEFGGHGAIIYNIFLLDKIAEGWISTSVFYVELLSSHYSYKDWEPAILKHRQIFIGDFEKRARQSIQFYPER